MEAITSLHGEYWFVNVYLIIYLISPYLKKLIDVLTKTEMTKLILILLVIFFGISILKIAFTCYNDLIGCIVIYLIGAYIKKYKENFTMPNRKRTLLVCFLIIALISITYILNMVEKKIFMINRMIVSIEGLNSPIVLLISVLMFNIFKDINIKENKVINKIAGATFGCYLIHENIYLKQIIWGKIIRGSIYEHSNFLIVNAVFGSLFVFLVCIIIEIIAHSIIEKNVMKILEKLYNKVAKLKVTKKIRESITNVRVEL